MRSMADPRQVYIERVKDKILDLLINSPGIPTAVVDTLVMAM